MGASGRLGMEDMGNYKERGRYYSTYVKPCWTQFSTSGTPTVARQVMLQCDQGQRVVGHSGASFPKDCHKDACAMSCYGVVGVVGVFGFVLVGLTGRFCTNLACLG